MGQKKNKEKIVYGQRQETNYCHYSVRVIIAYISTGFHFLFFDVMSSYLCWNKKGKLGWSGGVFPAD